MGTGYRVLIIPVFALEPSRGGFTDIIQYQLWVLLNPPVLPSPALWTKIQWREPIWNLSSVSCG